MTRLTQWAAAVLRTTASAACVPMTVSSHVERGLDLTRYHTFDWGTADALPEGDPRLERNPFFKDHFEGAVEKQLAARGLEHSITSPDLLIHYHATTVHRFEIDSTAAERYCPTVDCDPPLVGFEAETLILDFIDATTHRLIWRGSGRFEEDCHVRVHSPSRIRRVTSTGTYCCNGLCTHVCPCLLGARNDFHIPNLYLGTR